MLCCLFGCKFRQKSRAGSEKPRAGSQIPRVGNEKPRVVFHRPCVVFQKGGVGSEKPRVVFGSPRMVSRSGCVVFGNGRVVFRGGRVAGGKKRIIWGRKLRRAGEGRLGCLGQFVGCRSHRGRYERLSMRRVNKDLRLIFVLLVSCVLFVLRSCRGTKRTKGTKRTQGTRVCGHSVRRLSLTIAALFPRPAGRVRGRGRFVRAS